MAETSSQNPTYEAVPAKEVNNVIAEGWVYKLTAVADLVVSRKVRLLKDKFITYHDFHKDPEKKKSWYLDRKCTLVPAAAQDITVSKQMSVRPSGTWTVTAAVRGKAHPIELYTFEIRWPSSWYTSGYSSFTFGFKSADEARTWHQLFQAAISQLKEARATARAKNRNSLSNAGQENEAQPSSRFNSHIKVDCMADTSAPSSNSNLKLDNSVVSVPDDAAKFYDPEEHGSMEASGTSAIGPLSPAPGTVTRTISAGLRSSVPSVQTARHESGVAGGDSGMPLLDSDSDEDEYAEEEARKLRRRQRAVLSERWVPYKQTNGVSIYHHQHHDEATGIGGEYMVSAVVRGPPGEVLDVLMHGSANTTILGPARKVEVLECPKTEDDATKELMRITIEAPGWAGTLCAEREVLVERMMKLDEAGLYCILFTSIDDLDPRGHCRSAVNPSPSSATLARQSSNAAAAGVQRHELGTAGASRSIYKRPVRGKVRGGYTIAPLREYKLENSPESLITCIIKVDLGGTVGEKSWMRGMTELLGWRDAFLDRILMAVILVRDEVEQGRFAVQPFQLVQGIGVSQGVNMEAPPMEAASGPGQGSRFFKHATTSSQLQQGLVRSSHGAASTSGASSTAPSSLRTTSPQLASISNANVPTPRASKPLGVVAEVEGPAAQGTELQAAGGQPLASVEPGFPGDGHVGPAVLDLELTRSLATLERKFWSELHTPGADAPFVVRGPTYLKDKKKVPAGLTQFVFAAMDVIEVPHVVDHVARFLPSIRDSGIPFAIIINLIIPGNPLLGIVATFATEQHPDTILRNPPRHPMEEEHDWQPFDFVLHRFLNGTTEERNKMLKLIPHIADGSWMIKQSVGTTPVILGKALKTTYHVTPQYIEVDIDISANNVASYVTGLVRGATKSLVIDMGFVLEGTAPWELPEALLGTLRLHHLDLKYAKKIDITKEIPLRPPRYLPFTLPMNQPHWGHIEDLGHLASHTAPGGSAPVSAAGADPSTGATGALTGAGAGGPPKVDRVSLTRISGKSSVGSPTGPGAAGAHAAGGPLRGEAPGYSASAVTSAAGSPAHVMGDGHAVGGMGTPAGGRTPATVPGTPVQGAGGHQHHHSADGWAGAGVSPSAAASVAAATAAAAAGAAAAGNNLASAFAGATANATVAAGPGSNAGGGPAVAGTATPVRPSMPGNMSMSTSGALSVGGAAAPPNVGTSTAFGMRHRASHSRNASFQDFHLGTMPSYVSNPAEGPGSYNPAAAAGGAAPRDSHTGGPAAGPAPGAPPTFPSRLSNASVGPGQAPAATYSKVDGKAQ